MAPGSGSATTYLERELCVIWHFCVGSGNAFEYVFRTDHLLRPAQSVQRRLPRLTATVLSCPAHHAVHIGLWLAGPEGFKLLCLESCRSHFRQLDEG